MRFTFVLAVGAALSAALLMPASGSPTVMSTIPDHISENVRRELSSLDPSSYTLYERHAENDAEESGQLLKREPQRKGKKGKAGHKRVPLDGVIQRCNTHSCLSITFDDGPYIYNQELVDMFRDNNNQKTTFFVNGNNYRCIYDEDSVKRLRYAFENGHQICGHTWGHVHLPQLNETELDQQVQLVEDALWKILGVVPACIRAPYGEIRPDQVEHLNKRWGLVVVGWNRDTGDANGDGVQAGLKVYDDLYAPTHAIVLNHETVKDTVKTVIPHALKVALQHGYKGSDTVANTIGFNPYKVVGEYGQRDASWTCDGTPAPGANN